MKILIFGSNGLLGNYVYRYLHHASFDILPITRTEFDIYLKYKKNCLIHDLRTLLKSQDIKWVINCAGVINKRTDLTIEEMLIVNSYFPIILGSLCKESNIQLIHPTTDCVFSGEKGNYSNTDMPDCVDSYGISKHIGEKIPGTPIIIRASIIGQDTENRSLLSWCISQKNQTVNGYTNHFWNGITCLEYAKTLEKVIKGELVLLKRGCVNISCKNIVSKYELIKYISDIYKLDLNIVPTEVGKIDRSLSPNIITSDIQTQIREMRTFDMNIFRTPTQYKIREDNILMITSCIITRSKFTSQERYDQTLASIESVRKYLPETKIVLIENSDICEEWIENLSKKCDYIILCSNDPGIQAMNNLVLKTLNPGFGEIAQTIELVKHLDNPKFFYKLSGRYLLTEKNSIDKFDYSKFNFLLNKEFNEYHTTFYGLPRDTSLLLQYLENVKNHIINTGLSFETSYTRIISPKDVNLLPTLGCIGYWSGRYNINDRSFLGIDCKPDNN
jgi:dTDP-4-dehydrorhamnose reductase